MEGRQERRQLAESLSALRADVVENREQFELVLAENERRVALMDAALRSTPAAIRALPADSLDALNVGILSAFPLLPSDAALSALLASGALQNIDDVELRSAITGWSGRVNEPAEQMEFVIDVAMKMGDRMVGLGIFGAPECFVERESAPTDDFESCSGGRLLLTMLGDVQMRGLIVQRFDLTRGYVELLRDLEEPFDRLLALIPE